MALCAYQNAEWLSAIYAMVDEACVRDGALPPGMIGAMTRLVDTADADQAFHSRALEMLVTLHRLRAALRPGEAEVDSAILRRQLRRMCNDWIKNARFC